MSKMVKLLKRLELERQSLKFINSILNSSIMKSLVYKNKLNVLERKLILVTKILGECDIDFSEKKRFVFLAERNFHGSFNNIPKNIGEYEIIGKEGLRINDVLKDQKNLIAPNMEFMFIGQNNTFRTIELKSFFEKYRDLEKKDLFIKEIHEKLLEKWRILFANYAIYAALSSEEWFRINIMSNASKNAKEVIERDTLFYNKERQNSITNEINIITGGSC